MLLDKLISKKEPSAGMLAKRTKTLLFSIEKQTSTTSNKVLLLLSSYKYWC